MLSESDNDPAAAAKTLDAALAHDEPAPPAHRAQALIMRAGLAVSMDDGPLARRLLAEMRALPLGDGDRAALSAEMQTASDLGAMLK